nr:hypothetical protein [Gemmatimonadota bacterium]
MSRIRCSPPCRTAVSLAAPLLLSLAACTEEQRTPSAAAPGAPLPAVEAAAAEPPRFEDYPTGKVQGIEKPAPVDLSSHPDARQFRTALSRGAAEGPNFAGHYTVVSWGCGTMCQQLRIVDARTGRVHEGPISLLGVEYRLDSRLLVVNPPQAVRENPCPACETSYYVWNGEGLERVW